MAKGLTIKRVQRIGGSLAVTLPPAAVRVLRARAGRPVHMVVSSRGTVIVAPMSRRVGIKQEYVDLVSQLTQARRENAHLRKKLAGRPLHIFREGFNQGQLQAHGTRFLDLDMLLGLLRRLVVEVEGPGVTVAVVSSTPSSPSAQVHEEGAAPARSSPALDPPGVAASEGEAIAPGSPQAIP